MSPASLGSEHVGSIVDGKFTLIRLLGRTGHSIVFLTELTGDPPRKATIKLIAADAANAAAQLAQWAETRTLSHPHLIHLLHAGRCTLNGTPCLYAVTEYADEVLSEILPDRALTPSETREMLRPVLDTLSYLHGKGLVHGALKPSNIFVVNDQLKLSIGAVCRAGQPLLHASSGVDASSSIYDAPELAEGKTSVTQDMWSLGVLLVEAMTQHPPVWNKEDSAEPVVPASLHMPFLPMAQECLRVDLARRCTLSQVYGYLDPSSGSKKVEKPPAAAPSRRRLGIVTGAVLLVVVGVLVFVGLAVHKMKSSQTAAPPPVVPEQTAPASPAPQPKPSPAVTLAGKVPAAAAAPSPVVPSSPAAAPVEPGAVTHREMPNVPQAALGTIQGHLHVAIRVQVDPDGNVSDATIDSPGPSHYFANLALQAAHKWKFQPAQAQSSAAARAWILQFEFAQTGVDVTPVAAPR